jgi:hypothetical protein
METHNEGRPHKFHNNIHSFLHSFLCILDNFQDAKDVVLSKTDMGSAIMKLRLILLKQNSLANLKHCCNSKGRDRLALATNFNDYNQIAMKYFLYQEC